MTDQAVVALLGLFATMISVQVWIIRTLAGQNEKIVDRFLGSLETTIGKNTAELVLMSVTMTEATTTLREHMAASRNEHEGIQRLNGENRAAILDAIGKAGVTPRETPTP
jgi:hypothetical protein